MSVSRPKRYEVVRRTTRDIDGVTVGNRHYRFGSKTGAFTISDPGVAREMMKRNKAEVVVMEVDKLHLDVSSNFHPIRRALNPNWKPWYERRDEQEKQDDTG